jgi:hypothetical protein
MKVLLPIVALAGLVFGTAGVSLGEAQKTEAAPALIDVHVGDVTILEDVNVGVAATVAATVCGVNVGPIAILANQLDAGDMVTVCTTRSGDAVVLQR